MKIEIIKIKHYKNETEFVYTYTLKNSEGQFPTCLTGTVYYGNGDSKLRNFIAVLEKPYYKGDHTLCVYEINKKFAVYNENHEKITEEYDFMDDLIDEITEEDLKIFDFEC